MVYEDRSPLEHAVEERDGTEAWRTGQAGGEETWEVKAAVCYVCMSVVPAVLEWAVRGTDGSRPALPLTVSPGLCPQDMWPPCAKGFYASPPPHQFHGVSALSVIPTALHSLRKLRTGSGRSGSQPKVTTSRGQ